MFDFTDILKAIGKIFAAIILVSILVTLILSGYIVIVGHIENLDLVCEQTLELPITGEEVSVDYRSGQQTSFIVLYNDTEYTLPPVITYYVRTYHSGDKIPVKIKEYNYGRLDIHVDTLAIVQSNLSKSTQ